MKFFHISDLHIGLKLFNYDLTEDQQHVFAQVIRAAKEEKPDAIVIAGDIYDKAVPSAEAVSLFDGFITGLSEAVPDAEIMMISGNHDSAPRVNVFRQILSRQRIHMVGLPPAEAGDRIEQVTLSDQYGEVHFYLLPFVRPSMVRKLVMNSENEAGLSYDETIRRLLAREEIDKSARNVLVSHQFYVPAGEDPDKVERMDSEIRTVGNIDAVRADVLDRFDYAALGHIHKPMKVGKDAFRYCGTPLACSVSEAGQPKGIVIVEMGEKTAAGTVLSTKVIPLTPLRQVRVLKGPLKEVLRSKCEDYVTVCLTDKVDLDVIDMQDCLRTAFPHLLEIRREVLDPGKGFTQVEKQAQMDPFALCSAFLNSEDEQDRDLLREVINQVMSQE